MKLVGPDAAQSDIVELYEQLRRRAIAGGAGRQDGLAVLRRRGLYAWIAEVTTAPAPLPGTEPKQPLAGLAVGGERTLLVRLCADMLLNTLSQRTPT